ncbi:hypothetical protein MJG53_016758 [Ovis ammon polii x Ovis aries]|uniref:Uncharacterized protein n=1 Tax=Ovis ammon polii x Ovis aries TaxID=2918886 RepID=A0ACB9U922_9CETA|nr:hypothetical protein MJG53_016758 [Ovis ammon polii x Ovis aries]
MQMLGKLQTLGIIWGERKSVIRGLEVQQNAGHFLFDQFKLSVIINPKHPNKSVRAKTGAYEERLTCGWGIVVMRLWEVGVLNVSTLYRVWGRSCAVCVFPQVKSGGKENQADPNTVLAGGGLFSLKETQNIERIPYLHHQYWMASPHIRRKIIRAEPLKIQLMECPTSKAEKRETANPSLRPVARMAAVFKQAF